MCVQRESGWTRALHFEADGASSGYNPRVPTKWPRACLFRKWLWVDVGGRFAATVTTRNAGFKQRRKDDFL